MIFRNFTGSTLNLIKSCSEPDPRTQTLIPEPLIPKILAKTTHDSYLNGIPMVKVLGSEVIDLPEAKLGVVLIVAPEVLQACPERYDCVTPYEPVYGRNHELLGYAGLAYKV